MLTENETKMADEITEKLCKWNKQLILSESKEEYERCSQIYSLIKIYLVATAQELVSGNPSGYRLAYNDLLETNEKVRRSLMAEFKK